MKKQILVIILAISMIFGLSGCASWERGWKSTTSEFSGGMERVIEVYDYSGNLLKTYEGKCDIETNENKVLFDLDGKRVIIYNAIVITEEK